MEQFLDPMGLQRTKDFITTQVQLTQLSDAMWYFVVLRAMPLNDSHILRATRNTPCVDLYNGQMLGCVYIYILHACVQCLDFLLAFRSVYLRCGKKKHPWA